MRVYEGFKLGKEEALRIADKVADILVKTGNGEISEEEGVRQIEEFPKNERDYAFFCYGYEIGRRIGIKTVKMVNSLVSRNFGTS